jgi:hypothetical protein
LFLTKEEELKMMKFARPARIGASLLGMLAATLFVTGCATDKSVATANLAGTWQLTMPSGFQHKVHVASEGDQRYRISKAGVIVNGIYERRGNRLVMVEPADSPMKDWIWKIDNENHLTLVKEPDVRITGGHYRKSILQRGVPVSAPKSVPLAVPSSVPSTDTPTEVKP